MCISVLLTSTSLSQHEIGSTGLFHTSSSKKHFDSIKVDIRDTPPLNRGFALLCDLFHNLWNWNIQLCDLFHNLINWNIQPCDLSHNLSNWNIHDLFQFSIFPNPYQIPPAEASSVRASQPRCIRTNRTALDRRQQTKDNLFD